MTGFDAAADPGGIIQVYGVIEPDRTIAAQSVVVVSSDGSATTYNYAVSVLGAVLILAAFFGGWRFDRDKLGSSHVVSDVADLLSHVLIAYASLTIASWAIDPLTQRWVAIGMGGAAIPALVKLDLLVDDRVIEQTLNVPFVYDPIGSLTGVCLLAGVITLLFTTDRHRVYALLVAGGTLSLLADGLRAYADGHAAVWLYLI